MWTACRSDFAVGENMGLEACLGVVFSSYGLNTVLATWPSLCRIFFQEAPVTSHGRDAGPPFPPRATFGSYLWL